MPRFTLHVPEQYNDGTPIGPEVFDHIEGLILGRADGFTLTHGIGVWQDDGTTYREPVRLYAIDGDDSLRDGVWHIADVVALGLQQVATYVTEVALTPSLHYADGREQVAP